MNNNLVAIITLPGEFNFGNRLQLYATYRIYEMAGYSAVALVKKSDLPPSKINLNIKIKNAIKTAIGRPIEENPQVLSSPERIAAFRRFSSLVPERFVQNVSDIDIESYKLFSCGSDQVWNLERLSDSNCHGIDNLIHKLMDPSRAHRMIEWYFLGFCPREKRLALAPSIGLDSLSGKRARTLEQGVRNFDHLSIREMRGAELIREIVGRDAEVVCDPTLVLDAGEWRRVASDALTPSSKYVFTYLLGGVGEGTSKLLDKVTCDGGLPVIPLSDRQKPEELDAGPAEFISLIDNAAHVVTDSFHAAVFASILQTPLTIVRREGGANMFSRLETLARILGIEHKVYGSPSFDLSCAGNYEGVPNAIEVERRKFMDYLDSCLTSLR